MVRVHSGPFHSSRNCLFPLTLKRGFLREKQPKIPNYVKLLKVAKLLVEMAFLGEVARVISRRDKRVAEGGLPLRGRSVTEKEKEKDESQQKLRALVAP